MRTVNHASLEPYISSARLSAYRGVFAPADDVELLGCYLWGKELSASLFPLLGTFEVTFRNAIHNAAKGKMGEYWFDNLATRPPAKMNPQQQRSVNHFKKNVANARNDIRNNLRLSKGQSVSADRIVAKLTFGIWVHLLNSAYDVNRNKMALWPTLIRDVFPNAPKGVRNRDLLYQKLMDVNSLRNKAFHHEPVWNIGRPIDIEDMLDGLNDRLDDTLELLYWISHDAHEMVVKSGCVERIRRVCTLKSIEHHMNPGSNDLPYSVAKRNLRGLLRNSQGITEITVKSSRAGTLLSL